MYFRLTSTIDRDSHVLHELLLKPLKRARPVVKVLEKRLPGEGHGVLTRLCSVHDIGVIWELSGRALRLHDRSFGTYLKWVGVTNCFHVRVPTGMELQ